MSKKTLLILLALIAVLAVVWGLKEWVGGRQNGAEALSINVLKNIDLAQVSEIEIVKGEDALGLKREGEMWKIGEKEADGEKVKGALDALKNALYTGPVAREKQNHDKLGVGEQGEKVTVKQGERNFEFRVGNGGPTFDSSYIRLEREDDVYLADVNFGFQFSMATSTWEKKAESATTTDEAE